MAIRWWEKSMVNSFLKSLRLSKELEEKAKEERRRADEEVKKARGKEQRGV